MKRLPEEPRVARRWSREYINGLFEAADGMALVELLDVILSWPEYDRQKPTYALPEPIFVFVETLIWISQSLRSGTWTYFEGTNTDRQAAMLEALRRCAPAEFAEQYASGMQDWQEPSTVAGVDAWIDDHEDELDRWLWKLARKHRETIGELA